MKRLLLSAILVAGAFATPARALCAGSVVCAVQGCSGTVNVCGGGQSCSGTVSVCPFTYPSDCTSTVDVCPGLIGPAIGCGPLLDPVCDLVW